MKQRIYKLLALLLVLTMVFSSIMPAVYAEGKAADEMTGKADTLTAAEPEHIDLTITNNTGMFKAVSAYLEIQEGKTDLVMALSGSGYHELFKGSYEQAVANGDNPDNWIHGYQNADGKWEFRISIEDGESYVPCVAISQSYLDKYHNGQNSLERAFYPRQFELDREAKTLVTGDYEYTQELTVTNNVKMFKVSSATLETVGGPNSNNYKANMVLTMGSDSFDKIYVGNASEINESTTTIGLGEGNTFEFPVKWVKTFGSPETLVNLLEDSFVVSFHSAKKDAWYERQFTVDESQGTLVINEMPADYSAVDAALAKIPADLSIYTEESVKALNDAVDAVVRGLPASKQAEVDAMAKAIEDAIAALVEKTAEEDADYSAVDAALAKIPADLSIYTEESVKALNDAVNAVVRGLPASRQAEVDAMAKAIEDAIAALVEKSTEPETAFDNSTDVPDGEYEVPAEDFTWTGGTGKARLTLVKVIVKDGKATGIFTASSASMTHAYLGKTVTTDENPRYYDPTTEAMGNDVYPIVNQSVTLPVRINELVDISCRTVAMGNPHWVNYQYEIHIDAESPAEPDADYSAVDAALAKIPADLSIYTDDSVKALMDAKNAVVRGLKKSEQDKVDAMAKAIEDAIAALVVKKVDGRVDLEVINTTGMFKGLFAYVLTENGKSTLVVALTGSTYHYLYKGNYAQAVANGDNRDNWVKGYQNEAGKWLFDFSLTEGETYIPAVSISSTYLEKYEKGEIPLERSFYPRQFVLDLDAKTLTVGDYDETVTASVKSEVESFRVAETAQMRVVGGPNSNNFRVAPVLQMLDDTYDQVMYNTVENGKLTTTSAALGADNTFTIDILNAPNLFAFKDKEPLPLRLRDKATGETSTVWMTIDMLARTITISGEGQPQQEDHIYQFVAGGDGTWTKESDDPMLLTVKSTADDEGTFSRFVGVEVDGKELDKANYEATAGSVNIALKADYLNTLSEGKHTVTVKMTDGSVSTTLTIAAAGTEQPGDGGAPDTGDADVFVWIGLMITSAAALAVMLCEKKRRTVR